MGERARILPGGDGALVLEFGEEVDRAISALVMRTAALAEGAALEGVIELVPTFRSLCVFYDPLATRFDSLAQALSALPLEAVEPGAIARVHRIPVLYGGEAGPDLTDVAQAAGLSEDAVIEAHAAPTYYVYMLGFLPGYGYLGDVPEPLRLPRRKTPRVRVAPGSVAIAQEMAAIYSLASPGGWHILGNTPVPFFDAEAERPARLAPGEGVRFVPVDAEAHREIAKACEQGTYVVEVEEADA